MIEIDEYIVTTITGDATMISLMGIDASNNRVYAWYPSHDVVYNSVSGLCEIKPDFEVFDVIWFFETELFEIGGYKIKLWYGNSIVNM